MKKCQFCEAEMPDDNTFCPSCGTYCESSSTFINNEDVHEEKKVLTDAEQRRKGNFYAWISVFVYFSLSDIAYYTERLFYLPGKVGALCGFLVGFGLVLYASIKYPKCTFAKVCLTIYGVIIVLYGRAFF